MLKSVIPAVLLAIAPPAVAGPVLWQNVESGMPAAKLKELYPETKVNPKVDWKKKGISLVNVPVGKCVADVQITTDKPMSDELSVVQSVDFQGYGCAGATLRGLIQKYGSPLDSETDKHYVPMAYNDKTRKAFWQSGETTIRFKSESGGLVSLWSLKYSVARDLGL